MMNAELAHVADLARLNFLLGELYAEAVGKTARQHRVKLDLVGCHGQTLYHRERQSDFWPTIGGDLANRGSRGDRGAAGRARGFRFSSRGYRGRGERCAAGAVSRLILYRDARVGRIGTTALRRAVLRRTWRNCESNGDSRGRLATPGGRFYTGPGNMVIDAVMEELFARRYDRDGKVAASGRVLDGVIAQLLRARFFRQKPPRTAGREEFGREYVGHFLRLCHGASKPDVVATATALTARSIADAVRRFVVPRFRSQQRRKHEMIVSGGGAKNPTLMAMLRDEITPLGIGLHFSDEFGLPAEAKEAVALLCSRMRRGIGGQAMCRRLRERSGRRSWERSPMREAAAQEGPAQERIVILSEARTGLRPLPIHPTRMTILL